MAINADRPYRRSGSFDNRWLFLLGLVVAFTVVTTVGVSIAAIGLTESSSVAAQRSGSTDGAQIYSISCARCHGESGEAGIGPAFVGVRDRYPDAGLQELVVESGKGAMPSFRSTLTPEQIAAVVAFERNELADE